MPDLQPEFRSTTWVRSGTLARCAALAIGLGIPAFLAHNLLAQRTQELAEAEQKVVNTARVLEHHASRTVEVTDAYLRAVASLVGPRLRDLRPEALHGALRAQFERSRGLSNIVVVDRDGRSVSEAAAFPTRPLDVHDRDYFQALRDRPGDGLVIGRPIVGSLTGRPVLPIARRIDGPGGEFAGIVQAVLDAAAFQAVYDAIDNGPGAVLNLWRADGTLLVRSPHLPEVVGRNFASTENYRRHVTAADTRPFWSLGVTDGVERVIALGYLDGYPLYVGAALSKDAVLAPWRSSALTQSVLGGSLTVILVAALLLLAREIERRHAADALIRASEERYRLLAENTSDLIVFKPTMTGRRTYVSPAVRAILGWEPEEYAALPSTALVHPDEFAEVAAVYGALSPDRPQATHVHRLRHRDGHYVWIESAFKLIGDDPDDRTVVVSGRDVTARIEADRASRDSEARLRMVSEAATDMVTHMDLSGRRLYVSPASRSLLGYAPHELIGISPQEMIHPDDAAEFDALFSDLRGGGREHGIIVNRLRHRDGRWVWIEASLTRLRDEAGRTSGYVSSVRNVEARKVGEAALIAAREDAERANVAKGEFLAAMSHELRTPLNGVIGYSDLLFTEPGLTPAARLHAERIRTSGAALLTVVNDVLDYSKIEAGRFEIRPRPFSLAKLIDAAFAIVRAAAEAKGLALNLSLASAPPDALVGDEDRLLQILLNLLNNAVKFTSEGWIDLRIETQEAGADSARVCFRITDTGPGIAPDRQHLLFHRFSQIDGSSQRQYGGTGLGLAISRSLVELMDGAIGVESDLGGGSSFWFSVPLALAPASVAARPPSASGAAVGARVGRHLLVAEDVPINQDLIRMVLERAGHTVEIVGDGAQAVRAVQQRPYDLVLMDLNMPVMGGIAATRLVRAFGGAAAMVPIIALTANVLPDQIAEILAAGMDDHVGKPFQHAALLDAIDRWTACERSVASAATPALIMPPAEMDKAAFEAMRGTVGTDRMDALLGMLAEGLVHWFGPEAADDDRERLAQGAHAMMSAAGLLGFGGLYEACRETEVVCRSGDAHETALATLRAVTAQTLTVIGRLRAA